MLRASLLTGWTWQRKDWNWLEGRQRWEGKGNEGKTGGIPCAKLLPILCYFIVRKEGTSSPAVVASLSRAPGLLSPPDGTLGPMHPLLAPCSLEPLRLHHQGLLLHPQPQHLNRPPWVLASLVSPGFSASWDSHGSSSAHLVHLVSLFQETKVLLISISSPSRRGDALCVRGSVTPADIGVLSPSWLQTYVLAHLHLDSLHPHQTPPTQSCQGQLLHSPFFFFLTEQVLNDGISLCSFVGVTLPCIVSFISSFHLINIYQASLLDSAQNTRMINEMRSQETYDLMMKI